MTYQLTPRDWDQLLDGEPHLIDLEALNLKGGVANVRALAHYQASKRRGTVETKKVDNASLMVQGVGCRQLGVTARPLPFIPAPWTPALQEQPPTDDTLDGAMTPEEEEALLGPCSCGQSPTCLPTCARFS